MKAITILQSWAGLIAYGKKHIETRSWPTNYRGKIAIHAGKNRKNLSGAIEKFPGITLADNLCFSLGSVIAIADLVDCAQFKNSLIPRRNTILLNGKEVEQNELIFGDCTPGRWGWVLDNIQRIEPIPARGQQGLWNWGRI